LIGAVMPLRASEHDEAVGMDVTYHGEEAYVTGEGAILVVPEDGGKVPVPIADPG
jgi:Amt family ammonium transporter